MRNITLWVHAGPRPHTAADFLAPHTHTHILDMETHFDLVKQSKSTFLPRCKRYLSAFTVFYAHFHTDRAEQQKCPREDMFTMEADFTPADKSVS